MENRLTGRLRWWENRGLRAFALAFCTACVIFIPFMIFDQGYFLFYGDFNVQQIPFYQLVHDAIRSGSWGWNWNTDLGANLIGSYTFYNLTSPFLWLTLPFPSDFVPYLMGPLYILKFSCASLTAYIYLRRYVKDPDTAVLGGLLYAFSGFCVYNVFFNHFHEAIIIFPLLIAAMDEYHATGKRGIFALAVFASCFLNYYFFVGMVTFCVIYWCVRTFTGTYGTFTVRRFIGLAIEAVLGVLGTMVVLLPTILAVTQNSRVNDPILGWDSMVYSRVQRYWHIITCLFFPPDIPARANFTPESESNWASLGAWLPMFGTTGAFAWMQMHKKHWSKKMLGILLLMAFIPIFNSSFQLFNWAYYARWYYMLVLMGVFATVKAIESDAADWTRAFHWSFGITVGLAALFGLMPTKLPDEFGGLEVGLEKWPERFWTYVAIAVVSLLFLYIFLPTLKRNRKRFVSIATCGVIGISIAYSLYFIALGKTQSYDSTNFIIPYALNGGEDVVLAEDKTGEFIRVDFYETMDNMGMYWKRPTIQAFHSIVPGSVMEFYDFIDVPRDVASRPDATHYGLRGLTSVKYLFDAVDDSDNFEDSDSTKMSGYTFLGTRNGFDVYLNENYVPFGFTYTAFMKRSTCEKYSETRREIAMLGALVVEDAYAEAVSAVLPEITDTDGLSVDAAAYETYCADRRAETCTNVKTDSTGFTADITLSSGNYVFFSVPWERSGWTAEVDGVETEIVRANVGFMAVYVPEGTHSIVFHYETPGLLVGGFVSCVTLVLFGLYWFCARALDRRRIRKGLPV